QALSVSVPPFHRAPPWVADWLLDRLQVLSVRMPSFQMAPPWPSSAPPPEVLPATPRPPVMSRLLRATFVPAPSTSSTRELDRRPMPLIVTGVRGAARPWMVRLLLMTSWPLVSAMVDPDRVPAKTMVSLGPASLMSARSDPGPLSAVVVTI